ncbi:TPM domain-containing protein [Sphingobacterium daejeonense]|uniref:TPM domain-containing protein n=1 Tax=Sphingobacterium daejeonense TaxID=371142 RepID=UPI0021A6316F|nr:TPM domain-containing protein [Sphingobacterium daejeonense]MCT1531102.1 TPM domain-containing protein [Sphingobacterium daejeonense]
MEIFNQEDQEQVVHAISLAENRTSGEIRLVVERRVHNMDAIDQAKYYFEKLKMHETTQRNGVLIYLATDDHQFAIIGDTGINNKVPEDFWESTKELMLGYFKKGDFAEGLIEGIQKAGDQLATYFPRRADDVNELPNDIYFGKS